MTTGGKINGRWTNAFKTSRPQKRRRTSKNATHMANGKIKQLPKWQPLAIAKSPPILVRRNIACACRSVSRTIVSKHLRRCNDNKVIQGLQIRIERRMSAQQRFVGNNTPPKVIHGPRARFFVFGHMTNSLIAKTAMDQRIAENQPRHRRYGI